jgi:hypothetical protein
MSPTVQAVQEERVRTNVVLPRGLWREVQKLAIDRDTTASELLEQALLEWLKKTRTK